MPVRKVVLVNNEIYHVFNRAVANEEIFGRKYNLLRMLKIVDYYRFPQTLRFSKFKVLPPSQQIEYLKGQSKEPLVEIYAFAFMPNHYHLLVKQLKENGIRRFIANIQDSFARTFNLKNKREGALFQSPFKAKRIETEEQLIHISRYIHLNPVTSFLIEFKDLFNYSATSFSVYTKKAVVPFLNQDYLLKIFGSREAYISFTENQVDYQRKLVLIKNLMLE